MKFLLNSHNATFNLGKKIAKYLTESTVIALQGDLGSGKTTFVQGLAAGLKISQNVLSPTFLFLKTYSIPKHKILKTLCHVDYYRADKNMSTLTNYIQEYINDKNTLTVIEWPEQLKTYLPKGTIWIQFLHGTFKNKRVVSIVNKKICAKLSI